MGGISSGQQTNHYDEDAVAALPDAEVRRLYDHYNSAGEIHDHPELAAQYRIINAGENTPGARGYNALTRETEPGRTWDKKAGEGYEVDPDELKTLRTTILNDLNDLNDKLSTIRGLRGWSKEGCGGGEQGQAWAEMATNASTHFGTYLGNIVEAMNGVAGKLKATYDNYDAGHQNTQSGVDGVEV